MAERILDKSRYYDEARAFGRIVGQVSHENRRPAGAGHRRRPGHDGGGQSRRA
ncbi:hypothetical protein ACFOHS_02675 [Jhaorihella thermophila]